MSSQVASLSFTKLLRVSGLGRVNVAGSHPYMLTFSCERGLYSSVAEKSTIAVWMPVLQADDAPAGKEAESLLSDPRVEHDDELPLPTAWMHQLGLDERHLDGDTLRKTILGIEDTLASQPPKKPRVRF